MSPAIWLHDLERLDPRRDLAFAHLPWGFEECGLSTDQWRLLSQLSCGLLFLDALQQLNDHGYRHPLLALTLPGSPLAALIASDEAQRMALHLSLRSFNRLTLTSRLPDDGGHLAGYRHHRFTHTVTAAQGEKLLVSLQQFLDRWGESRIFLRLFTLRHHANPAGCGDHCAEYTAFLRHLSTLYAQAAHHLTPPGACTLLRFWLERCHRLGYWPDEPALASLAMATARCAARIDLEHDRVLTYADYCGSPLAGQMIRQSATELRFPVRRLRWEGTAHRDDPLPSSPAPRCACTGAAGNRDRTGSSPNGFHIVERPCT
ncbi:hypothetical protein [Endothiovibrio diazotrophicus]